MNNTNKAFARYFQAKAEPLKEVYAQTRQRKTSPAKVTPLRKAD